MSAFMLTRDTCRKRMNSKTNRIVKGFLEYHRHDYYTIGVTCQIWFGWANLHDDLIMN